MRYSKFFIYNIIICMFIIRKESQNIFCHNLLFNQVASMIRIQISVPHPCIRIIPFSLSRLSSWFILGPFFLPPSIDVKNSTVRKAISERTVLILITVIRFIFNFSYLREIISVFSSDCFDHFLHNASFLMINIQFPMYRKYYCVLNQYDSIRFMKYWYNLLSIVPYLKQQIVSIISILIYENCCIYGYEIING